ncbi:MAG: endonuclease domain-containing protein [Candidatus Uhrbacteria bacterium]|nr:endonuclease domain-containing protein [Candidatus Uhrbacteria bacterium]
MQPIQSPAETFTFRSYSFDRATGEAEFVYAIDDIELVDRMTFPLLATGIPEGADVALDRALFALHIITGTSYYKAKLPKKIVIESGKLTKDEATFWDKLYTLGLGEFFFQNDLDFRDYIHFPFEDGERVTGSFSGEGAFVMIGGGKDSLVAIEMLCAAEKSVELSWVGKNSRIREVADAVGAPYTVIDRQIDPKIIELNKQGAWNGHIPITAVISFAEVVLAILHGKRDVIFSNERSANIGNVVVDGIEINHQYSKSLESERDLQEYLTSSISPDIRVFSLLRPLSELDVARRFAAFGKYFNVFSSCNANFRKFKTPIITRWCGKCPKCTFVFAILAAFIPRRKMIEMFGEDVFMNEALLPMYKDLLGCGVMKPFECVGEPEEVIAAFGLIHGRGEYEDSPILKWVEREVLAGRKNIDGLITHALTLSPEHAMPQEYADIVYASR